MSLQAGLDALKQGRSREAVQFLEKFCQSCSDSQSNEYLQAQMGLVKAYQRLGQIEKAIALCQPLAQSSHPQVSRMAKEALSSLSAALTSEQQPFASTTSGTTAKNQPLTAEQLTQLLQAGNAALRQQKYAQAIEALEKLCQRGGNSLSQEYIQAQMSLVKAYQGNSQFDDAIALCDLLATNPDKTIQIWVQQSLTSLSTAQAKHLEASDEADEPTTSLKKKKLKGFPKAGRYAQTNIKLAITNLAGSIGLASLATISLLFGTILLVCLSIFLLLGSQNLTLGLMVGIAIALIFNIAAFFVSPAIIDWTHSKLYNTRWVSLEEVQRYSPEAAEVIQRVCEQKKLKQPKLGIINDQNPTSFTYGTLPNSARLVVSRGLFNYLDDEEIATVYAHELGHIVNRDFAVITLASALPQVAYLAYMNVKNLVKNVNDRTLNRLVEIAATPAYGLYLAGTYIMLYLSRTRAYYADRFSAEITGNPNALSRALVKIAYGIMQQSDRTKQPSKLLEGTRALGIYDLKTAASAGTTYRIASQPQQIGRVFLWDIFNPWGWWMELSSTHPLTGKRVRALSKYAEQLSLDTEFDMTVVVREGNKLNKSRLYGNFFVDQFFYSADLIGAGIGLLISLSFYSLGAATWRVFIYLGLIGFGLGTLIKMIIMFPDFQSLPESDVLTLMSDPYANPLRGRGVKVQGEIIGRGGSGSKLGADLKLRDETGIIYLRYTSRYGPLGNFLFGLIQSKSYIGASAVATGWFRRGITPWIDLTEMHTEGDWKVLSYPRLWLLVLGFGAVLLGFILPSIL